MTVSTVCTSNEQITLAKRNIAAE